MGLHNGKCLFLDREDDIIDDDINKHISVEFLKKLYINDNLIGNKGAKLLTKSYFPNMESFNLRNCKINCEGVKYFSKIKCPELIQLSFGQ